MKLLVLISILSFSVELAGQSPIYFDAFKGNVYSIHYKKLDKGYQKAFEEYEVLERIELKEINIPSQVDKILFPGVNLKSGFGMVLHSTLHIQEKACYELDLTSDDGSILWLNDELVIDNDGSHKMKNQVDTIELNAGTYKAKLWYCNTFGNKYGLILKERILPQVSDCKPQKLEETTKINLEPKVKKYTFSNRFLFDTNEFVLKESATVEIDNVIKELSGKGISVISIIGFTDNVGEEAYNNKLSIKRAFAVKQYLVEQLDIDHSVFKVQGFGEYQPIASNETEEGRQMNRRVELTVWFD